MKELNVNNSMIITLDDEDIIEDAAGTIHVIPAWKYLLSKKSL